MNRIHLERLDLREMYGRRFDLTLKELSSKVTAVYGPNASGKTAVARAASLIFSTAKRDRGDRIYARLSVDQQPFDVKLEGRSEPISWPQSPRVDLYSLSIVNLLNGPRDEDQEQIKQALAGGLNLQEMAGITAGKAPKELIVPIDDVRKKRQNAEALRSRESALEAKRREVAAAEQAEKDLPCVEGWIRAAEHENAANARQAEIDEIHRKYPGIDRQGENAAADIERDHLAWQIALTHLQGATTTLHAFGGQRALKMLQASDREQVLRLSSIAEALGGKLNQAKNATRQAVNGVNDSQRALADLRSDGRRAPGAFDPVDAQTLADLVKSVGEAAQKSKDAATRLAVAEDLLRDKRTDYTNEGGDPGPHPASAPSVDQVGAIVILDERCANASTALQRAREDVRQAQQNLDAARLGLGGATVPAPEVLQQLQKAPGIAVRMDEVRAAEVHKNAYGAAAKELADLVEHNRPATAAAAQAVEALRDWLRSIPDEGVKLRKPMGVFFMAIGLAVVALVLGFALNAATGFGVGAAGLVIVAVVIILLLSPKGSAGAGRPSVAGRIPQKWEPAGWTVESVASQYAAAQNEVCEMAAVENRARDFATRANAVDDQTAREDLQKRKRDFTAATGITLGDDDYNLADFVHRLLKLVDAENVMAAAREQLATAQKDAADLAESRRLLIGQMGAPVETGALAKAWADALRELVKAASAHAARIDASAAAERELLVAATALKEFFARFDWPAGGDPQVASQGLVKWFDLTRRLIGAEAAMDVASKEEQALQNEIARTAEELRAVLTGYAFPCGENPIDCVKPFIDWFEKTAALNRAETAAKDAERRLLDVLELNGVPNDLPLSQRLQVPAARREAWELRRSLESEKKKLTAQAIGYRETPGWEQVFNRLGLGSQPMPDALKAMRDALMEVKTQASEVRQEITTTETLLREAARADDLAGAEKSLASAVLQLDKWLARKVDEIAADVVTERITEAYRDERQPDVIKWANRWLDLLTDNRYRGLDAADGTVSVIDAKEDEHRKGLEELSTGTRAHLALSVRLAVIQASEEKARVRFPLFLDEVMAASDPEATKAIAQALGKIAEERQVVVLTNQPDDVNALREVLGKELMVQILAGATAPVYAPPAEAPADMAAEKTAQPPPGLPIESSIDQWPVSQLAAIAPELDISAATVNEAHQRLDGHLRKEMEIRLAALEAVRAKAAQAHRHLQWRDIESESWADNNFDVRIQEVLSDCNGAPSTFLIQFKAIKGMRKQNIAACEQWLSDNAYLAERASLGELTQIALGKLPADYPNRQVVAMGLATFFVAYAAV